MLLTVVTGLVDAVSFLRLGHVFVANMTGNIVFIGLALVGAPEFSLGRSLTALAAFVAGLAMSSFLPPGWTRDRARLLRTSAVVKLLLALPVVIVGSILGIAPGRPVTYGFIALLATSMGVQNATVQRLAVLGLTTTVLTTTLTRLVADLRGRGWHDPATQSRAASVAALFAGATIGAVLVLHVSTVSALDVGTGLLAAVGLLAHRAVTTQAGWTAYPS